MTLNAYTSKIAVLFGFGSYATGAFQFLLYSKMITEDINVDLQERGSRVISCECATCKSYRNGHCLADTITINESGVCQHNI